MRGGGTLASLPDPPRAAVRETTLSVRNFAFFAIVKELAKLKTREYKSSRNVIPNWEIHCNRVL